MSTAISVVTSVPVGYFTRSLVTEQIGHELWRIEKRFAFISSTGIRVLVPKDFETDLASIPGVLQSIVSKVGYWSQAAVVHDLLYRYHRLGLDDTITKLQADKILREGCFILADHMAVPLKKRRTTAIYKGVRFGGIESWETPEEKVVRLEMINSHITDE